MRTLEILIIAILVGTGCSLFISINKRSSWFHLLPAFSLFLIFVHLLFEGYRWQMLPTYFYAVLLFLLTARNLKYVLKPDARSKKHARTAGRVVYSAMNMFLVFFIALPPLLVPIFKLPKPTGPFAVGMKYDLFLDKNRPETVTENPDDFIEIPLQIWYPAEISVGKKPVRYWENASELSRIVGRFWEGLPPFLLAHFSLVKTHSYADVPVSRKQEVFPVLIFSHGALGMPQLNTALMENLASRGFIICAISHTDYSPFFRKPDGQIQVLDPDSMEIRSKTRENDNPEVRRIANQLMQTKESNQQKNLLRQFLQLNPANQKSLFRWVEDISFAIDEMVLHKHGDDPFYSRLDLDNIGIFGVSFGGAASVQACAGDNRCKAAVSMDCIQFGDPLNSDIAQPLMFMNSEQYQSVNDIFSALKKDQLYYVSIRGTTHQNFSDISIWGGLFKMKMLGGINGARCLRIQSDYILAFFNKYLKGIDSPILDGSSLPYHEVTFEVKD
jgi:hypothetical protein